MKQNILIAVIATVIVAIALTAYFKEKEPAKPQTPSSAQMNMSTPGVDHSKMQMGQ